MKRRRTDKPPRRETRPAPFHAPFQGLRGRLTIQDAPVGNAGGASRRDARKTTTAAPARASEPRDDAPAEDDGASFLRAMADVRRLEANARIDAPPPAVGVPRIATVDDEAEALATLSDLVSGTGGFDISDSAEYLEGSVVGLDARILRRLRHGEFPYQATLDLHGMAVSVAQGAVEAFVTGAFRVGQRCVLIVHGRGRNSWQQTPVLKERLKSWLAHGKVGRVVLAFTSARPADGGTGAVYVLLRRRRGAKEPIDVYEGAKRE